MIRKLILLLMLAAAGGWAYLQLHEPRQVTAQIVLVGNVDIREVEMAFRQSGRLMRLQFEEGESVKTGELLAELDAQPFKESLARAQAELNEISATLERLTTGHRPQEIARAEAIVRQAEATLIYAVSEFDRQQSSASVGASTQQALDQAKASRAQAEAQLDAARQDLSLTREGSRKEDIAAAKARKVAAEAAVDQAKTALTDTRLLAPSSGVIQARLHEPGSMVGPTTPVYTISLRDPVYLRAYVGETQLAQVVPGARVQVSSDSTSRVYHGRIGFVSPRAEFTPKSVETTDLRTDLVYRVRITVDDADAGLRHGMPVTIQLDSPSNGR